MADNSKQTEVPPNTPPIPPLPPTPIPPIELNTIWDVAKIVIFVTVWYITSDANHALTAAVDYSKVAAGSSSLVNASWNGATIGVLQGLIMSVQALAIIWASPTLFAYLGPVLTAAFRTPIKLLAELRRAIGSRSKPGDGNDKDCDYDGDDKKKDDGKK